MEGIGQREEATGARSLGLEAGARRASVVSSDQNVETFDPAGRESRVEGAASNSYAGVEERSREGELGVVEPKSRSFGLFLTSREIM
ncbi:hypothetical protein KFK09_008738 [Dendrobium nobile]|uniref:Uncharacterized protein n=1 Tax=Dendrobium nobile TaxID=94219 RepID=A0A8T3BQC2_DENNO|nr:hypothetical protein KFK09_008738 [Dendrobium nobile]